MKTREDFIEMKKLFLAFCELFDKKYSTDAIDLAMTAFYELNKFSFMVAVEELLKNNRTMPTIADVVLYAEMYNPNSNLKKKPSLELVKNETPIE